MLQSDIFYAIIHLNGGDNLNSEGQRLRILRKELHIKQGEFAEKISTTQGHISDIENGRKNLSDRTIKLICLEDWDGKTINEEWLRTGKGEMFRQLPETDEVAEYVEELLMDTEDSVYKAIRAFLKTYGRLNDSSKAILRQLLDDWVDNINKEQD